MFTHGTLLSLAVSDADLAGKLLSEVEMFDGQDQAAGPFEGLQRAFQRESRSMAVAACQPCAESVTSA